VIVDGGDIRAGLFADVAYGGIAIPMLCELIASHLQEALAGIRDRSGGSGLCSMSCHNSIKFKRAFEIVNQKF
jgi:hypothetical protein